MIIISDTTPIIALLKADRLTLLRDLYQEIIIPEAVLNELTVNTEYETEIKRIHQSDYITVKKVQNQELLSSVQRIAGLDAGESEAIALAAELNADILLVDDLAARNAAANIGLTISGTMGTLRAAYVAGLIEKEGIEECMDAFKANDIYISEALYEWLSKAINHEN